MHADKNSVGELLGKAGCPCSLEVALLGDRSHSGELRSCCELRWAEGFPCSTGKVTVASVCTDTLSMHLLQGLFSFGLGMMPHKIPVAFTATKIISCS